MRTYCNAARCAIRLAIFALPLVALVLTEQAAAQSDSSPKTTGAGGTAPAPAPETRDTARPKPSSKAPVNLRLRSLEQRVQALKERAWRAKARVGMLKEAVIGGGIGSRATVVHKNKMSSAFRLVQLTYTLDGAQIFTRTDKNGSLHKLKTIDILTAPVAPGSHTLNVRAVYRGNGHGVLAYLKGYKFTVRASHTLTITEGKSTNVIVSGYERGGIATPLEKRPAIGFKLNHALRTRK